ncbi:MAG: hypothetical protein KJ592_04115 [Nanoarchaeota archaeon]|nr:hypothetical protein [Nanoarchaeota archaeon]
MNKKGGIGVGEVLMIIGALMILGWALLKGFGVINTLLLVQMIPYVGGAVSVFGGAVSVARMISKVDGIGRGVVRNGKNIEVIGSKVDNIERDFVEVRNNQRVCLDGKLKGSPYS